MWVLAVVTNASAPSTVTLYVPAGVASANDGTNAVNTGASLSVNYAPPSPKSGSTLASVMSWGMAGSVGLSIGAAAFSPFGTVGVGALNMAGFVQTFAMTGALPITNMPSNYRQAANSMDWVLLQPPVGPAQNQPSAEQKATLADLSVSFPTFPVEVTLLPNGSGSSTTTGTSGSLPLVGNSSGSGSSSSPTEDDVVVVPLPEADAVGVNGTLPTPFDHPPPPNSSSGDDGAGDQPQQQQQPQLPVQPQINPSSIANSSSSGGGGGENSNQSQQPTEPAPKTTTTTPSNGNQIPGNSDMSAGDGGNSQQQVAPNTDTNTNNNSNNSGGGGNGNNGNTSNSNNNNSNSNNNNSNSNSDNNNNNSNSDSNSNSNSDNNSNNNSNSNSDNNNNNNPLPNLPPKKNTTATTTPTPKNSPRPSPSPVSVTQQQANDTTGGTIVVNTPLPVKPSPSPSPVLDSSKGNKGTQGSGNNSVVVDLPSDMPSPAPVQNIDSPSPDGAWAGIGGDSTTTTTHTNTNSNSNNNNNQPLVSSSTTTTTTTPTTTPTTTTPTTDANNKDNNNNDDQHSNGDGNTPSDTANTNTNTNTNTANSENTPSPPDTETHSQDSSSNGPPSDHGSSSSSSNGNSNSNSNSDSSQQQQEQEPGPEVVPVDASNINTEHPTDTAVVDAAVVLDQVTTNTNTNANSNSNSAGSSAHHGRRRRHLLVADPISALSSSGFSYVVVTATTGTTTTDGSNVTASTATNTTTDGQSVGASALSRIRTIQAVGAGANDDSWRLNSLWDVLFWTAVALAATLVLHVGVLLILRKAKKPVPKMLHLPRLELLVFMMTLPMVAAAGAALLQSSTPGVVVVGVLFSIVLPFGFLGVASCFLVRYLLRSTVENRRALYVVVADVSTMEELRAQLAASGASFSPSDSLTMNLSGGPSGSLTSAMLSAEVVDSSSILHTQENGQVSAQRGAPASSAVPSALSSAWKSVSTAIYTWVLRPVFGFPAPTRGNASTDITAWLGRGKWDAGFVKRYGCFFEDAHGPQVLRVRSQYDPISPETEEVVGPGVLVPSTPGGAEGALQALQTFGVVFAVTKMVLFAVVINAPGGVNSMAQVLALVLVALMHVVYLRLCTPYRLRVELAAEIIASVCDLATFGCGVALIAKSDWSSEESEAMGVAMLVLQAVGFLIFISVRVMLALRTLFITVGPAVKELTTSAFKRETNRTGEVPPQMTTTDQFLRA